ncbi:MAG: sulfite exporter TauE/SafE family protein [Dehalococcoidia bacterium]|nr:sulfite exporter TauE/SafE family protein [Dehalococcoidia bacterium]
MIGLLKVPTAIATATSQFTVIFTALAGVLVHVFTGQFRQGWRRTGLVGIGAILGAQLGVYLSGRVNHRFVMWGLSLALVAGGVRQIVSGMV